MDTTNSKTALSANLPCAICQKVYKNRHSLRSHVADCHDNEAKRVHPLQCAQPSCTSSFMSRQKYERHSGTCKGDSPSTSNAASASSAMASSKTQGQAMDEGNDNDEIRAQETTEFDVETWVEVQGERVSEDDQGDSGERFERLQEKLISATGNRHTAEFLLSLTEPVAIILQNGEMEN
ncbi:hypothetical protein BGZ72_003082, partial [Mortierella alpina]